MGSLSVDDNIATAKQKRVRSRTRLVIESHTIGLVDAYVEGVDRSAAVVDHVDLERVVASAQACDRSPRLRVDNRDVGLPTEGSLVNAAPLNPRNPPCQLLLLTT